MKRTILLIFLFIGGIISKLYAQDFHIESPDKKTDVSIHIQGNDGQLSFDIRKNNKLIVPSILIGMELDNGQKLGKNAKLIKSKTAEVNEVIFPVVHIQSASIPDVYNQLILQFQPNYEVNFRVYNDGLAYRFVTHFTDSINVVNELYSLQLPDSSWFYYQGTSRWMNSYEHTYHYEPLDSLNEQETNQLPMLICEKKEGIKLMLTEADLYDYPGLYFSGNKNNTLMGIFPPAVKTEKINDRNKDGWDRDFFPESTYSYLTRTKGNRTFPWRILAIADSDAQLLTNQIVYKLGEPNKLSDISWIKPGKVAWDWWNDWNITGVGFKSGLNTKTYKYYIDFAARHGLEYIIIDEGWYDFGDLTKIIPEINLKEIVDYGMKKNVGVIIWCVWRTLENQMQQELNLFHQLGIKGIKVDFMDRDDQAVVDFYWHCASEAAKRHLLVDFHGAHKPTGLQRTFPNIVNFEGVPGLEQDKWSNNIATPDMAVTIPFIRMFAGPLDYTPGAMRNAQLQDFAAIWRNPMSLGTRCQQLAMYVVYEAPLQMLADNPTAYEKEKECLDFISKVPTTWDMTEVLAAKVGKYIALARKHGNEWFVGAMTDWTTRDITLDFSFLEQGHWNIEIFKDGVNADHNGSDYEKIVSIISTNDHLSIHLAPGGGWAARIYR